MAAKKKAPSKEYAFVHDFLKRNPKAEFATIRDAAKKKRMTIYPIVYGRAQAALGIVKSKPRGSKKAARKVGRPAGTGARRGRPPASMSANDSLSDLISGVKDLERGAQRVARGPSSHSRRHRSRRLIGMEQRMFGATARRTQLFSTRLRNQALRSRISSRQTWCIIGYS